MIINRKPNGLKGQHILAQGKRRRSVALGLKTIKKIVCAIMFIKEEFSFRTKWMIACFPENDVLQFRPKQNFHILYFGLADGFFGDSFTRGAAVRLSAHAEAPGYAILPLQGKKSQKLLSEKNRNKY